MNEVAGKGEYPLSHVEVLTSSRDALIQRDLLVVLGRMAEDLQRLVAIVGQLSR